jgi:hypothetical protein
MLNRLQRFSVGLRFLQSATRDVQISERISVIPCFLFKILDVVKILIDFLSLLSQPIFIAYSFYPFKVPFHVIRCFLIIELLAA